MEFYEHTEFEKPNLTPHFNAKLTSPMTSTDSSPAHIAGLVFVV